MVMIKQLRNRENKKVIWWCRGVVSHWRSVYEMEEWERKEVVIAMDTWKWDYRVRTDISYIDYQRQRQRECRGAGWLPDSVFESGDSWVMAQHGTHGYEELVSGTTKLRKTVRILLVFQHCLCCYFPRKTGVGRIVRPSELSLYLWVF